jgi:hypothetical protein
MSPCVGCAGQRQRRDWIRGNDLIAARVAGRRSREPRHSVLLDPDDRRRRWVRGGTGVRSVCSPGVDAGSCAKSRALGRSSRRARDPSIPGSPRASARPTIDRGQEADEEVDGEGAHVGLVLQHSPGPSRNSCFSTNSRLALRRPAAPRPPDGLRPFRRRDGQGRRSRGGAVAWAIDGM